MEQSVADPSLGIHNVVDSKLESEESCTSLARSDSGQGKSLSNSVDFHEENIPPDDVRPLESTKEIDDLLQNDTFEEMNPFKMSSQDVPPCMRVPLVCTGPDSGIEKSPVSEYFKFPPHFKNISGLNPVDVTNHFQEISSKDDMSYRKQQKDIFEGPVSDVDKVRWEKTSLKRQDPIDIPQLDSTLHLSSFDGDKSLISLYSNGINGSPDVSFPSSTDSSGKFCHVSTAHTEALVNGAEMQAQTDVWNGHNEPYIPPNPYAVDKQNGCGLHLTSTLPEAASLAFHMSPQGMVPKNILDKVVKELTSTKKKISELTNVNSTLYKGLSSLENDVESWKNKYFEIQEQLIRNEHQLQTLQHELNLKHSSLEVISRDLEAKDIEIQHLREECQVLRFQKEGLESFVPNEASHQLDLQFQGSVCVRPHVNSPDETQVKTV